MTETKASLLRGRRLLVVEDDYLIASDFAHELERRGVRVVGPAGSVAEALRLIDEAAELDGALLDINLGSERVYPVADRLIARRVPFVFATGYSALVVPTAYGGVPRVEKPVDMEAVSRLLALRIEQMGGSAPRP